MTASYRGSEAQEILEALVSAFPGVAGLDQMVNVVLGEPLNRFANTNANIYAVTHELCIKVESRGKLDDLIRGAAQANPGNVKLLEVHIKIYGHPPGGPIPSHANAAPAATQSGTVHDRCVLGDDVVFIDREDFRDCMRNIFDHEVRRLLIVTGGRQCGKSYSAELIRFGSRKLNYNTVTVPLSTLPLKNPVKSLAQAIVGPMQPIALTGGMPEQGKETSARWLHHPLMSWIEGWMHRADGTWWIILDDFDHEYLPREIYDFIVDLGVKIENDLPDFRLALLGYDRAVPARWEGRYRHEEIKSLEKNHLVEFFTRLYQENNVAPDQGTIEFLADEIYDAFVVRQTAFSDDCDGCLLSDDPDAVPMKFLNRKLRKLLSRVQGEL